MFFLLPFQAKNPPEGSVIMTYVVMVIVGLASLVIEPAHIITTAWSLLFIWLFGCAVEGRLGPGKFLVLVLTTAGLGTLASSGVTAGFGHEAWRGNFGMGLECLVLGLEAGYIFMFPFAVFRVWYAYWFFIVWWGWGVWEVQARWLVLLYLAIDYALGLIMIGIAGTVLPGAVALRLLEYLLIPLVGLGAGLLVTWLMRPARDTEDFAVAQASRVDMQDIGNIPMMDLEALMQHPAGNVELIMTYLGRMYSEHGPQAGSRCASVISANWDDLLARADTVRLAHYVQQIPMADHVPAAFQLLRLAHRLESVREYGSAIAAYQRIYQSDPNGACTEPALMRMAALYETQYHDAAQTRTVLEEVIKAFPTSPSAFDAREQLRRLEQQT